jgi:hypothetical protein
MKDKMISRVTRGEANQDDRVGLAPEGNPTDAPVPPRGQVPDTLDLADHARLAINGILGSLNQNLDYECVFLNILDVHPAYMLHWSSMVSGVMPKYIEALPLLRQMSGSEQGLDLQQGFMDAMLKNMAEDGLIYDRQDPRRPWNVGVGYGIQNWDEDYANMAGNGRAITGLLYWLQWTGDDVWRLNAKRTAERMLDLAVTDGEMAFYPNPGLGNDFSYPRKSGWTTRKPPETANEGFEGASMFYLFQPLRGFTRYFAASGDERFKEISRKFINFGLQPKFWGGASDMSPAASTERGHFKLHFHASAAALRGVLDYGIVADDQRTKEFVADAYGFARQMGIGRLGLFPTNSEVTEGCTLGDMIGLAVALSDAGLGDYWDDVEKYARNGLLCAQATDLEELQRVSEAGQERPANAPFGGAFDYRFVQQNNKGVLPGQEIHDRVLERTIGAFGHIVGARYQTPMMMHCCTANASQGLYYAWEGILRRSGTSAEINLWLNRRSPWADVWSWLPHEGRLLIQNKGMRQLTVRKPGWAHRTHIHCQVNGQYAEPRWVGGRMIFDGLQGAETLLITTPVNMDSVTCTMVNLADPQHSQEQYCCVFHGYTAVDVQRIVAGNDPHEHSWYRIFRREAMKSAAAPMKHAPAYVHPEKLINWLMLV